MIGVLVAALPLNAVRVFLYRWIFGYRIHRSAVGWNTLLIVDRVELNDCKIGRNNRFIGPMTVVMKSRASIGDNNQFSCGWWAQAKQHESANYKRYLEIGEKALVTSGHYFDVVGSFILGNSSWIAGFGSQFWTHGAGVIDRNIRIGDQCYIGSAVRFAPGASIGDNTIVGIGSVVVQPFEQRDCFIAGQPAKIIKEDYDWKTKRNSGERALELPT